MNRRILVFALIVFFIAGAVVDQRYWWWADGGHIPVVVVTHMFIVSLWMVAILLHVFWLNRKPFFSFFKRAPDLSARGVIQIIVLLLTLLFLVVAVREPLVMVIRKSLYVPLEPWGRWWYSAWAAALIGHIWLNRKALFSHFGQRLTVASLALISLTAILLPLTTAFVGMFR